MRYCYRPGDYVRYVRPDRFMTNYLNYVGRVTGVDTTFRTLRVYKVTFERDLHDALSLLEEQLEPASEADWLTDLLMR